MDFLNEVDKKLDLPPAEKKQVMRELKSHYEEIWSELVESGMDSEKAEQEAARRLGDPDDLASRLQSVHCTATWKSALLTAFPFLGAAGLFFWKGIQSAPISLQTLITDAWGVILLIFTGLLVVVSIKELERRRRPVWLATWLPVGLIMLSNILGLVELQTNPTVGAHHAPGNNPLNAITGILLMGVIGLSTLWEFPKLRWSIISITAVGLVCTFVVFFTVLSGSLLAVCVLAVCWLVMLLVFLSLPMITAIGIFARPPFGNTAQASLFLLAYFGNATVLGETGDYSQAVLLASMLIALGLVTIAYARASSWQRKEGIVFIGIMLVGILSSLAAIVVKQEDLMPNLASILIASAARALVLTPLIIIVPIWLQRKVLRQSADK